MVTSTEHHSYTIEGRRIWMTVPYGSPVKNRIKNAGAHWDPASKRWWIGTVARDIVIPIMERAMTVVDTAELVSVEVDLDYASQRIYGEQQTLTLRGVPLVYRTGRDGAPRLADNVLLVAGGILSRGGSRKYPYIEWQSGTAVRVEVAEPVAREWVDAGLAVFPSARAASG